MRSPTPPLLNVRQRRGVAWLAVALLALAALWPTLSRATAGDNAAAWAQEICSVGGVRLAGGEPQPADPAHALDHCPLCQLQRDLPALPPAPTGVAAMALAPLAPDALPRGAPPAGAARWSPASPRAPPASA